MKINGSSNNNKSKNIDPQNSKSKLKPEEKIKMAQRAKVIGWFMKIK